jgi:hypothetical protein
MGSDSASPIFPPHGLSSASRHGFPVGWASIGEQRSKCLRSEGGSPSSLSGQPSPTWGSPDREGEGIPSYAQVRGRWACLLSAMPTEYRNRWS